MVWAATPSSCQLLAGVARGRSFLRRCRCFSCAALCRLHLIFTCRFCLLVGLWDLLFDGLRCLQWLDEVPAGALVLPIDVAWPSGFILWWRRLRSMMKALGMMSLWKRRWSHSQPLGSRPSFMGSSVRLRRVRKLCRKLNTESSSLTWCWLHPQVAAELQVCTPEKLFRVT